MHYIYDVMHGGWIIVIEKGTVCRNDDNDWGDLGVSLGCVVRVESTRQDATMSLRGQVLPGGM